LLGICYWNNCLEAIRSFKIDTFFNKCSLFMLKLLKIYWIYCSDLDCFSNYLIRSASYASISARICSSSSSFALYTLNYSSLTFCYLSNSSFFYFTNYSDFYFSYSSCLISYSLLVSLLRDKLQIKSVAYGYNYKSDGGTYFN